LPETSAGPSERAGFIDAPEIGPPNIASSAIVPPIAIAARLTDGSRVGGDGHDHEHQEEAHDEFPEKRLPLRTRGERRADVADIAQRAAQKQSSGERTEQLGRPVGERAWPGEVAAEHEGEGDGGVEMGAGMCPTA
jgi:hypothetical protein